jgi:hypothetical protein
LRDRTRAAAADTMGVAMEVPVIEAYETPERVG